MAACIEVGPAIHLQHLSIDDFPTPNSFQSDFTEYLSDTPTYYSAQEGYVVGVVNELLTIHPAIPPTENTTWISYSALEEMLENSPLKDSEISRGCAFLPLTENLVASLETASKTFLKNWIPKPNCNGEAALWLQYWPRHALTKYRNPVIKVF